MAWFASWATPQAAIPDCLDVPGSTADAAPLRAATRLCLQQRRPAARQIHAGHRSRPWGTRASGLGVENRRRGTRGGSAAIGVPRTRRPPLHAPPRRARAAAARRRSERVCAGSDDVAQTHARVRRGGSGGGLKHGHVRRMTWQRGKASNLQCQRGGGGVASPARRRPRGGSSGQQAIRARTLSGYYSGAAARSASSVPSTQRKDALQPLIGCPASLLSTREA